MMTLVEARQLTVRSGGATILDAVDLHVEEGRILGLVGPNGAGKTTLLQALVGLTNSNGTVKVLGMDPWVAREHLMHEVGFVADVAVLPRWIRVAQAIDYIAGIHPGFDRAKAGRFLGRTKIRLESRVAELSKGMVAQLHLALVMATNARVLVLDEPTLGLDLLYRKQFFDSLLGDYHDHRRAIVIATHQVEEVERLLTDVVILDHGRTILAASMDEFTARYCELVVNADSVAAARALGPIHERKIFGRSTMLFANVDRERLSCLGHPRCPTIADVFMAVVGR